MYSDVNALLARHFAGSYAKGMRYFEQRRVRLLEHDADRASGEVSGTRPRPYRVRVHLVRDEGREPRLIGDCTCPIGIACKHIVALALAWQAQLAPAGTPPGATQADPDPWRDWAQQQRNDGEPRARDERIVYCCRFEAGELFVRPVVSRPARNGWSAGRALNLHGSRIESRIATLPATDRALVGALIHAAAFETIDGEDWALLDEVMVLPLLATKRVHLGDGSGPRLRAGEPRKLEPRWFERDDGTQVLLARAGAHGESFGEQLDWYFDVTNHRIGPVESDIPPELRRRLHAVPHVHPEHIEQAELALADAGLTMLPPLRRFEIRIAGDRAPRARLLLARPLYDHGGARLPRGVAAELTFRYADRELPASDSRRAIRRREGDVVSLIVRDDAFEASIARFLRTEGFHAREATGTPAARHWQRPRAMAGPEIAAWLREFTARATSVLMDIATDEYFPVRVEPELGVPELAIEETDDGWFEAKLGITIDGEAVDIVPLLLHALDDPAAQTQHGLALVLPSGRRVVVPQDRLTGILAVLADLERRDDAYGVPRERLAAIQPPPDWRFVPGTRARKFVAELERFGGLDKVVPPDDFAASLRPYQLTGLAWLDFLRRYGFGGVLADDMGLGKTVQVLAFVARERALGRLARPVLVVCPTSVAPNWLAEAQRFAPALRTMLLSRGDRTQQLATLAEHDLVVTSYALMLRDFDVLAQQHWSLLVLDESQWLKNRASRGFRAATKLQAAQRLCLTGTPVENHLDELKAQFDLAMPGLLGDEKQFKERFRNPIERERDAEASARLRQRLRPFLLRRRKSEVAAELPPRTSIEVPIELGDAQRDLYETIRARMEKRVREALAERGLARSHVTVLDALLKLRQACCDPALVALPQAKRITASAKRESLNDLLPTLVEDGRSVLVFSQFTAMLDLIERDLRERKLPFARLDGNSRDRREPVRTFQNGEVPILLVSLKAGGVGLNLTRADTVILYDPWWNPAAEAQAIDRAHRIGQDKPVFVYQLVCKDTVEERMQALKARKRAIADAVLSSEEQAIEKLEASDLVALFAAE